MAYDRFLIAPFKTGLQTDLKPFIIPEDAFQQMNNAYVFRGRLRKRFGSLYSSGQFNTSRLRILVGTTNGTTGNLSINLGAGGLPAVTGAIGQSFVVGNGPTETYTVWQTNGTTLTTSVAGGTATFNTATGALVLLGALKNKPVYFYPNQPVMGLGIYENGPLNNQPAVAFDLQSPYIYNGSAWQLLSGATGGIYIGTPSPLFTGTNNNYFWISNWRGTNARNRLLYVTNNVDPVYWWDGTGWGKLQPVWNTNGGQIITALIILPYKGYTIMLNTQESYTAAGSIATHSNRCRFSIAGDPLGIGSWLIPQNPYSTGGNTYLPAGAGFTDAGTLEAIIGAEFIKDRLIVYFEQSTWELAFTGNNVNPFQWQKINTELGAVGTFSTIPFDKAVLGVGKTGVHACSGANVERIDQKIPDEIFNFKVEGEAYNRINGIRIYQPELAAWSYVEENDAEFQMFSNKIMVYNYENQTWSFNDDCIMCWGYFEQQTDLLWQDCTFSWASADFAWNSNVQPAELRQVIFGNQQGCICIVEPDVPRNASNMIVTNVTNIGNVWTFTVINHNQAVGNFVLFENNNYLTFSNGGIFQIYTVPGYNTFTIDTDSVNNIAFIDPMVGYQGGMTMASVSKIDIISKQWDPYLAQGFGIYLAKIVFAVSTTDSASIQVDYASDDSSAAFVQDSGPTGSQAIMGSSVLDMYPYPGFDTQGAARLWHPVYFQGQGNCVQINIYYNDQQMLIPTTSLVKFEIDAIMLFTMRGVIKFA